jgi:beta-glucosidase
MRKTALATALIGALGCPGVGPPASTPGKPPGIHPEVWPAIASPVKSAPGVEEAVSRLLAKLTLEEKVGQIIQAEINSVTPEEVRLYHLGSVLNGGGGWPGAEKESTVADWVALADAFWEASMDASDGFQAIPILWGLDAVHGHNNVIGATLFPHNIGLGAANDPELIREVGRVTAREVAVTGQDWNFGPTVAVVRDDRWGRTYESYSEDPEIVRAYAAAMVEGIQGRAGGDELLDALHLLATAKHFLADGGTHGGRDQGDSVASEEELRDVHAAGYASALAAGVQTVMASFSSVHGRKMHGHEELLTRVLKGRMGFDGFVVGDWNGHGQVPGCTKGSCAAALNAGLDMFMVPQDWKALYEATLGAARSGEIPLARLDDAVRRILRVKMRAGLFARGRPSSRPLAGRAEILGSPEHRAVARRAVRESLVLLNNNGGLLPLAPSSRVLVAGDGADSIGKQTGGWTITWQGTGNGNEVFPGATSIWQGIREVVEAGGGSATLSPDGSFEEQPEVAIVVFGEDPYAEFQGDRDSVDYAPADDRDGKLLRSFAARGVPVVSVFLSGRPLWVNPELNASDAFVAAWLPGTEGGGVADLLFASPDGSPRHDFRGRLAFSWPRVATQAVVNRHDPDYDPLFAYGYGLTYADKVEVGRLSEETTDLSTASRTVYFDRGPVPPWRLYLGDEADRMVPAETAVATTRGSYNLVVSAIGRQDGADARAARWSGAADAGVYLRGNDAVDLSRESNGEMALSFDAYLEEPPAAAVTLGMGCGDSCSGAVDLTGTLAGLPRQAWATVVVRLRCFEEAGADMTRIETPFALATGGSLALRFAGIRLVSAAEREADCP